MKSKKNIVLFILSAVFINCLAAYGTNYYYDDDYYYGTPSKPQSGYENTYNDDNCLNSYGKAVLDELNYARTKPYEYATRVLEPLLNTYEGSELAYLRECISEMKSMQPIVALKSHAGLTNAAIYWVNKQGPSGDIGHDPNLWPRVKQTVKYKEGAENISYGYYDARGIVVQLLVDSDIPSRGHRKNILNGRLTHVGIAVGNHSRYDYMCVQDFARF